MSCFLSPEDGSRQGRPHSHQKDTRGGRAPRGPLSKAPGGGRVDRSPISEWGPMQTFVGTCTPCPPCRGVGNGGARRTLLAFKGVQVQVPPAPSPAAQGAGPGMPGVGGHTDAQLASLQALGDVAGAGESGQGASHRKCEPRHPTQALPLAADSVASIAPTRASVCSPCGWCLTCAFV